MRGCSRTVRFLKVWAMGLNLRARWSVASGPPAATFGRRDATVSLHSGDHRREPSSEARPRPGARRVPARGAEEEARGNGFRLLAGPVIGDRHLRVGRGRGEGDRRPGLRRAPEERELRSRAAPADAGGEPAEYRGRADARAADGRGRGGDGNGGGVRQADGADGGYLDRR